MSCVENGPGAATSVCMQPCNTYQDCALDEICDTQLSTQSCYPNYDCTAWAACSTPPDNGGSPTGTCMVYATIVSGAVEPYTICFQGGDNGFDQPCDASGGWSQAAANQCEPEDYCGETPSGNEMCYQGCDPTNSLGSPSCQNGLSCIAYPCDCDDDSDPLCTCNGNQPSCDPTQDPYCNPYFGYCG
jgi:hypothetical protein